MFLFGILWLVSPIILLVILASASSKKSKTEKFITYLYQSGRISREEYLIALGIKQAPHMQSNGRQPYPSSSQTKKNNTADNRQDPNGYTGFVGENRGYPNQNGGAANNAAYMNERKKGGVSAFLVAGVVLVTLAGFAFIGASWSYFGGAERTLVVGTFATFFLVTGLLIGKKLKLDNTGSALFSLGALFGAITYLTAGYYRLFGEAFSLTGTYQLSFGGVMFFAVAVVALWGAFLFKKNFFVYASMAFAGAGVPCLIGEFTSQEFTSEVGWAALGIILTVLMTVWVLLEKDILKLTGHEKRFEKGFKLVTFVFSVVYGIIAQFSVIFVCSPTEGRVTAQEVMCLVLLALQVVQCASLRFRFKGNCFLWLAALLIMEFAQVLTRSLDGGAISFAVILFVVGTVFLFTDKIRTEFTNVGFPAMLVFCAMTVESDSALFKFESSVIMAMATVLLLINMYGRKTRLWKLFAVAVPSGLLGTAYLTAVPLFGEEFLKVRIFINAVMIAVCVMFELFARYGKNLKFNIAYYTSCFLLGICCLYFGGGSQSDYVWSLIICVGACAVMTLGKNNILTILPVFEIVYAAEGIVTALADEKNLLLSRVFGLSVIILFCTASRLLFDAFAEYNKTDKIFRLDTFAIGGFLSTLSVAEDFGKWGNSVMLLLAGLCCLNLYRKSGDKQSNEAKLVISAILFGGALIARPKLDLFDVRLREMFNAKINILVFWLTGTAVNFMHKRFKGLKQKGNFGVSFGTFMLLWAECLWNNEYALNAVVGLLSCFALLVWACCVKRKNWFVISVVSLIFQSAAYTLVYVDDIQWWMYLMIAGVLFIAIATVKEYMKNMRERSKDGKKRFFDDWV